MLALILPALPFYVASWNVNTCLSGCDAGNARRTLALQGYLCGRVPPPSQYYAPPHVLRLVVPWMSFDGLLDTAFEQIRHYAAAAAAVSLRLMRAFIDIASTTQDSDFRSKLVDRAGRVAAGCAEHLPKEELAKLEQRLSTFDGSITAQS
jgi:uncharacterized membrane protein